VGDKITVIKSTLCLAILFLAFQQSYAQQQPTYRVLDGDTINRVDAKGLKQGFWKIFGANTKNSIGYLPTQLVEQGMYISGRKNGVWKRFFPNGDIRNETTYVNGRIDGKYKEYYRNGQIQEEGNWWNSRNVSEFSRYYPNGNKAQEFVFKQSGKRDGEQRYYYPSGKLMIMAEVNNGKKALIKEYFESGELKANKVFDPESGELDQINTEVYQPKLVEAAKAVEKEPVEPITSPVIEAEDKPNVPKAGVGAFTGNGFKRMYNAAKQLSKVGEFKNYRLMDGKQYFYDDNGLLIRIKQFENGRFIGDAPLNAE